MQLQLRHLNIERAEQILLSQVNATWQDGDFIQILGHNGIGKTSLLRTIVGLNSFYQGEIALNDLSIHKSHSEFLADLLFLGHKSGIKPQLSPWENLQFYQQVSPCIQGEKILWHALEQVGLGDYADVEASSLSAGQQRRVALARLWLTTAKLWILDEPFTALDVSGVAHLTQHIENHCQQGGIAILTSHQAIPSSKVQFFDLANFVSKNSAHNLEQVLENQTESKDDF